MARTEKTIQTMRCPVPARFRHVGIAVSDVDRLVAFYGQMLGFVVTDRGTSSTGAEIVFMTASSDQHHQLVLVVGRDPDSPSTVNQLAFHVEGLAELQAYARFLQGFADVSSRAVSHGNAWSIYFDDPEGNGIEVYCDTPWYVSQPRAIPFDVLADPQNIHSETADFVESDPSGVPVEEWRVDVEERLHRATKGGPLRPVQSESKEESG